MNIEVYKRVGLNTLEYFVFGEQNIHWTKKNEKVEQKSFRTKTGKKVKKELKKVSKKEFVNFLDEVLQLKIF